MGTMAFQITSLTTVYSTVYSGTDQIMQINHNTNFTLFRTYVAYVIKDRAVNFLPYPLEQTDFRTAVNVCAEKDTYKPLTKQATAVIVVVPDAPNLSDVLYLAHPIVKSRYGWMDWICLTHWGRDEMNKILDDIFKRIFFNENAQISI